MFIDTLSSSLLTTTVYSPVKTTLVYNDREYPIVTL